MGAGYYLYMPSCNSSLHPILGNLSDQYGRRPVILFSLFGFGIDYIFLGFAPSFGWLFLGRTISGITGASFTTASAYIADISTAETRAKNFGMIGAAFGLGFIIGPAIGGLLTGWGIRAPFYAAAILTLLNWLYGYFVLPESLSIENRRKFDWKRANPVGSLLNLKKYPAVAGLILALTLVYLGSHASAEQLELFYGVPVSMDTQNHWHLARSRRCTGSIRSGRTDSRDHSENR